MGSLWQGEIDDESGFMAIFDPDAYESFVSEDWEFDQLLSHFYAQMQARSILIWGTGFGGCWRVGIESAPTAEAGFRCLSGSIKVSKNRLCLINYESLTMGAQNRQRQLPEKHLDFSFPLVSGTYNCTVKQLFDNSTQSRATEGLDFIIEILPATQAETAWSLIPWR